MAYQVLNLSSEWHHHLSAPSTHSSRDFWGWEGGKARGGGRPLWCFREGELARQWSVGDLVGAHRITATHSIRGMAAGSPEGDAHMEELLDQGLGMEETDHCLLRRPSLKENYHSDSLLAPDTDFMAGRELSRFQFTQMKKNTLVLFDQCNFCLHADTMEVNAFFCFCLWCSKQWKMCLIR